MDPLLLLAALGLIGFSLFTLGAATGQDIPNSPLLLRHPAGDLRA